jgi:hypothetical protein
MVIRNSKGQFIKRPPGAYPLFDWNGGSMLAVKRWDKTGRSATRRNIRRREKYRENYYKELERRNNAFIMREYEKARKRKRRKSIWSGMRDHKG